VNQSRIWWVLFVSVLLYGCVESPPLQVRDVPATEASNDASADAPADTRPVTCGMGLGDCDPVLGTGCPTEQRCEVFAQPTRGMCVPAGSAQVGDPCSPSGAECSPGLICINRKCMKLCCEMADDAPCQTGQHGSGRSFCTVRFQGLPYLACTIPGECNWVTQEGCPTGQACRITSGRGEARCVAEGSGRQGERCSVQTDCGRGLICTGPTQTTQTCARVCDVRNPTCGGSLSCMAIVGDNVPFNYGICE
jgi:hypothetical protein